MNIFIAGDYVPANRVAEMLSKNDFSFFDSFKPLVAQSDFSILNLECPIVTTDAKPIIKQGPNLKSAPVAADALNYLGINMVTLANNHILDYGSEGLASTIEELKKRKIDYVGVGDNLEDAANFKIVDIKGKRLAVINACENESSIATKNDGGANPIDTIPLFHQIKEAKSKADYVLVIAHGGYEMYQLPSPRMVELYRFFVEAGADAVINHHQHCFSGYEIYNGKPIIYGLGNFCFDNARRRNSAWNFGYAVTINFDNDITFDMHPYIQCNDTASITLRNRNEFDKEIENLNKIINNSDLLSSEVEKYFQSQSKNYKNKLEPFQNKLIGALRYKGFIPSMLSRKQMINIGNAMKCESHRDRLIYMFDNLNLNK